MSLKERLFKYGLYGEPVKTFSAEDLSTLRRSSYAEIVRSSEIEKLMTGFTLEPLKQVAESEDTAGDCVVRMSTAAWRDYIFGHNSTFRSREYFQLIDLLLKQNNWVSTAMVREELSTPPKTLHYIVKKLTQQHILSTRKIEGQPSLRLLPIVENTSKDTPTTINQKIFTDAEELPPLSTLELFNNMSFISQVEGYIKRSTEGVTSSYLHLKTGVSPRYGLKILQQICLERGTEYTMVSETHHKSTICKAYWRRTYEGIVRRRVEQISGGAPVREERKTISMAEKTAAMQHLADKYETFALDKDILNEISDMTGWAYTFDRKTLLRAAKAAGLHVLPIKHPAGARNIISKYADAELRKTHASIPASGTEHIQNIRGTECLHSDPAKSMRAKIDRLFVSNLKFVRIDNGAPLNVWEGRRNLLYFCLEKIRECGVFSIQDLRADLPVSLFYQIIGSNKPNFRYEATFGIWKREREKVDPCGAFFTANSLFLENSNGHEILDESVYDLIKILDKLPMKSYLELLPSKFKSSIRRKLLSRRLDRTLRILSAAGFISLVGEEDSMLIQKRNLDGAGARLQEVINKALVHGYVAYNVRKELSYKLLQCDPSNFENRAKEIIVRTYPKETAETLLEKLLDIKNARKLRLHPRSILDEADNEAYINIKRSLVDGTYDDYRAQSGYDEFCVKRVVEYMLYRKLAQGRYTDSEFPDAHLLFKFLHYFDQNSNFYKQFTNRDDSLFRLYFFKIFRMVQAVKSIDLDAVLERCKYVERFELLDFLRFYDDVFEVNIHAGFILVSLREHEDPFV